MAKMTVGQFLDYLDGYGIIYTDEELVAEALNELSTKMEDYVGFDNGIEVRFPELEW